MPHNNNLQEITLPVPLLTLHTRHIIFTKRTFYICSDYIFHSILLNNNILQKKHPHHKQDSTS